MDATPPHQQQTMQPTFSPLTVTLPSTITSLSSLPNLFTLPLPTDCTLSSIVCSYGFFRLPPNTWIPPNTSITSATLNSAPTTSSSSSSSPSLSPSDPPTCTLHELAPIPNGCFIRSLRFDANDTDAIFVAITQEPILAPSSTPPSAAPSDSSLLTYRTDQHIVVRPIQPPYSSLSSSHPRTFNLLPTHLTSLHSQVTFMLRLPTPPSSPSLPLPNPYHAFYSLIPSARERGFARLFHSPTTYENLMKTITLCNTNWKGTIKMNATMTTDVGLGVGYQLHIHTSSPAWQGLPPSEGRRR